MLNFDAVVQVTFFTNNEKFVINKTQYSLPVNTTPDNLNSLIKTILTQEYPDRSLDELSFDFLVNQEILTQSLLEYLNQKSLSTEAVIEIEYAERIRSPDPQKLYQHNDWVSCVDSLHEEGISETFFVTGCYDNSINVWTYTSTEKQILTKIIHEGPVKDIKLLKDNYGHKITSKNTSFQFVTASHDHTLKLWKLERQIQKSNKDLTTSKQNWNLQCKSIYRGHTNSVECVSLNPDPSSQNGDFCSGSWDKMIKLWSFKNDDSVEPKDLGELKTKKTKLPILTIANHDDVVTSIQWITKNEICSASWDHKIKIWDVEAQKSKSVLAGQKALLSISYSPLSQLIISGSTDNYIRLWDPRSDAGTIVKASFSSHKNWVSSVNWSPLNANLFASGSYDSIVKIWDVRSTTAPLYDLYGQKEKILCTAWSESNLIISGGSDKSLQIFKSSV